MPCATEVDLNIWRSGRIANKKEIAPARRANRDGLYKVDAWSNCLYLLCLTSVPAITRLVGFLLSPIT
jgi:hypothetical protein